jgi:sarcosine oxidase
MCVASRAEVAVVGAGIMGLATAQTLARDGRDVVVYEQFRRGHTRGSSHGRSRIVRLSYPQVEWVRLAQKAMTRWRHLEAETGEEILQLHGLLELDVSSRDALDECGVPWQLLSPEEVSRRFPVVAPGEAVFQPDAGFIRADRANEALARGLRIVEETRVESLEDVDAEVVVVTAGAWAKALLAGAGIELPVVPTRETVAYFQLESRLPVPSVVEFKDATYEHGLYALPDPQYGLKAGWHRSGAPAEPDDDGAPDPAVLERVAEWVGARFPGAGARPAAAETCLYTNAPGERFLLERHGRIVVGSACSGHGFKFAPLVGERLAALVAEALA